MCIRDSASAGDARALLSALAAAQQELLDRDTALSASIQENERRLAAAQSEAEAKGQELSRAREERDGAANVISGFEPVSYTHLPDILHEAFEKRLCCQFLGKHQ